MRRLIKCDNVYQLEIDYYLDLIVPYWNGDNDSLKKMPLNRLKAIYHTIQKNLEKEKQDDIKNKDHAKTEEMLRDFQEIENSNRDYDFEEEDR